MDLLTASSVRDEAVDVCSKELTLSATATSDSDKEELDASLVDGDAKYFTELSMEFGAALWNLLALSSQELEVDDLCGLSATSIGALATGLEREAETFCDT